MKKSILTIVAAACCVPALAMAEGKDGKDRKPGHRHPRLHKALLEKFDKDGDGKLDKEERTALRTAMAERRSATIKKYDTDGDGELSKEEKIAAMKAFRAEMLTKYDADGDNQLSQEERENARKAGEQRPFFGPREARPKRPRRDRTKD